MLVGFLLAFLITDRAWKKFQNNPTMTSLLLNKNEKKIVYPTISICPHFAEDDKLISEVVKQMELNASLTQEVENLFRAIPNFSFGSKGLKSVVLSDNVKPKIKLFLREDPRTFAFKFVKTCADVFEGKCNFKSKSFACCESFRPVYSEHGFCYAFNTKFFGTAYDE